MSVSLYAEWTLKLSDLNKNGSGWIKFSSFPSIVCHNIPLIEINLILMRWAQG
jgi:hypothetical protein